MDYKLIDGILYQAIDTAPVKAKLNSVIEQVRPYKEGIKQCEDQIEEYKKQIATIIETSGLNKEIAKAIDPEKADFLGL